MKRKEYLSRYLDEPDSDDLNKIKSFSLPWQRNFITRFYKQLSKQHLSKKDITKQIELTANQSSLLPNNYNVPQNTLSQFTNYKSVNMRTISVTNLIAVALALGVSINYLLGIDSCETPENTDISKATGLSNETIETIKTNENLQEKLNFFLLSPEINKISEEIDKLLLNQRFSNDILNAYSKELFNELETAYKKFFSHTFATDRTELKYREYLYQQLTYEKIKTNSTSDNIIDYLKLNLSADRFTQIQIQLEKYPAYDDKDIYHVFVDMTADFTYSAFEEYFTREIVKNRISQSIMSLIDKYIQTEIKKAHDSIRKNIGKLTLT